MASGSSAFKYNRPRGRVRIDADADRGDGLVRISVTDTGPGFTREEAARIFRPFERLARGDGVGAAGRARAQGFDDYWVEPLDVSRVIAELGGASGPERVDAATGA
jgi:hypothetical protein